MANPIPLQERIELAEAVVELVWAQIGELPKSRGGVIMDYRHQIERDLLMAKIDGFLDRMLPMYDQRRLELTLAAESA